MPRIAETRPPTSVLVDPALILSKISVLPAPQGAKLSTTPEVEHRHLQRHGQLSPRTSVQTGDEVRSRPRTSNARRSSPDRARRTRPGADRGERVRDRRTEDGTAAPQLYSGRGWRCTRLRTSSAASRSAWCRELCLAGVEVTVTKYSHLPFSGSAPPAARPGRAQRSGGRQALVTVGVVPHRALGFPSSSWS